jgi:hypothetical protein
MSPPSIQGGSAGNSAWQGRLLYLWGTSDSHTNVRAAYPAEPHEPSVLSSRPGGARTQVIDHEASELASSELSNNGGRQCSSSLRARPPSSQAGQKGLGWPRQSFSRKRVPMSSPRAADRKSSSCMTCDEVTRRWTYPDLPIAEGPRSASRPNVRLSIPNAFCRLAQSPQYWGTLPS